MTADDVTLTEAEREALDEALWGGRIYDDVPAAVGHILADRLAQVTARAERAEAQVERVRGLAAEFRALDYSWDGQTGEPLIPLSHLLAALAETVDSEEER